MLQHHTFKIHCLTVFHSVAFQRKPPISKLSDPLDLPESPNRAVFYSVAHKKLTFWSYIWTATIVTPGSKYR